MKKYMTALCALAALSIAAQDNTWTKIVEPITGVSPHALLLYSPAGGEYILNLGDYTEDGTNARYPVQVFTHTLNKWINALPNDTLYKKWADSTGFVYGNGRNGYPVFSSYYWKWQKVDGYLRPNLTQTYSRIYGQGCRDTDNGKLYYYGYTNQTISYDPATRTYDTISVAVHPNSGGLSGSSDGGLRWGAMAYDALNHEVVLFGGCGLDQPYGSPMTWTFSPATSTWTKLDLAVQPRPRAYAPMVYDPVNQVIVLFGGDHLDYTMNDTWVYHCATRTWEKKLPAVSPSPRAGHGFYYLPKQGKIALMGGYCYTFDQRSSFEIWTYDVASNAWGLVKRLTALEDRPKNLNLYYAMYYLSACDTGDNIIALADSSPSIYHYDPATYRMHCNASTVDPAATSAYGAPSDMILHYPASLVEPNFNIQTDPEYFIAGVADPDTGANESFLANLTAGTWTTLTPPKAPGGHRDWGTAILDPVHDVILTWSGGHVAHCGTDVPQYSIHQNRYHIGYRAEYPMEFEGYNNPCPAPFTFNNRPFMPMHTVKSYAFDVNMERMIYTYYGHTWVYNPEKMDWDSVNIHNPWGSMSGYSSGLVSTAHGAFNWFGNNYPGKPYLFDTARMNWRALPSTETFPGFYADDQGVVYDSKRDRVILFSKTSAYAYGFTDSLCVQLHPTDTAYRTSAAVNTGYLRESAYLPAFDIVLFPFSSGVNGHLAYDCADDRFFVVHLSGTTVAGGVATGFMYDAERDLVWAKDNYSDKLYAVRLDAGAVSREKVTSDLTGLRLALSANPFHSSITLTLSKSLAGGSLRIMDVRGRLVADLSAKSARGTVAWNAHNCASGLYVAVAEKNGRAIRKNIVLTR